MGGDGSVRLVTNGALLRDGLRLEYITLGWNVVGTVVVVVAAILARSAALAGFGLDSLIEIFASVVVVWQLRGSSDQHQARALRMIGASFLVLAVYVLAQSLYTLLAGVHPDVSVIGIVWLIATVIAMLGLSSGKRRVGRQLGNPVLVTEARVTQVDAVLAGAVLASAVLIGLVLNATLGWWWADPIAGLTVVAYALREGIAVWQD